MTIKDIAKECGCGIGTVSRVLNNHPDVSEETRAKVMAVVDKYGCRRILNLQKDTSILCANEGRNPQILLIDPDTDERSDLQHVRI